MEKFTVIILFNPIEKKVFYVMKGNDGLENCYYDLIEDHQFSGKTKDIVLKKREHNVKDYIDDIRANGSEPIVLIQKRGLTEKAASALEMYLIWRMGRKNIQHGSLLNLHPGGKYKYPTQFPDDENEINNHLKIQKDYPVLTSVLNKWEHETYYNDLFRKYGYSDDVGSITY